MFYNLYFFGPKNGYHCEMSNFPKNDPTEGRGCTSPSFSVQICRACLTIGIEYQFFLTYTEVIN